MDEENLPVNILIAKEKFVKLNNAYNAALLKAHSIDEKEIVKKEKNKAKFFHALRAYAIFCICTALHAPYHSFPLYVINSIYARKREEIIEKEASHKKTKKQKKEEEEREALYEELCEARDLYNRLLKEYENFLICKENEHHDDIDEFDKYNEYIDTLLSSFSSINPTEKKLIFK